MRHWTQATRTLICIMLLPYKETGALHRRSHMCTYHWTSSNLTIGTRVSVTVTTNRYLSATKKVCTHNSVKKKKTVEGQLHVHLYSTCRHATCYCTAHTHSHMHVLYTQITHTCTLYTWTCMYLHVQYNTWTCTVHVHKAHTYMYQTHCTHNLHALPGFDFITSAIRSTTSPFFVY